MKRYYADLSVFIEAENEDEANKIAKAAEDRLNHDNPVDGVTSVTMNDVSEDESDDE